MKVVDLNLLLYAIDDSAPRHVIACAWLEDALSGTESVGMPWVVLLGFVRLSTRAAVFSAPLTAEEAISVVDGWLALETVTVPTPGTRHSALLRELLSEAGTAGNLVSDAHLAALTIEHAGELYSCDADFSRFSGLRWIDPLRR